MTTRGWGPLLVFLCGLALSCASSPPPVMPAPGAIPAATFPDGPAPLPRYHSKRLALWLPLPSGSAWRIDDHSRPEIEATHSLTRSRVVVAVFRTEDLVGRSQCEERAIAAKLVPDRRMQIIDEEVATTQRTFDTRIRVALAAPEHEGAPIVGHVLAFGGYLRKCFVFDFSTEVAGISDEPVLSSRLAVARARILGGLLIDTMGTLSRDTPAGPGVDTSR